MLLVHKVVEYLQGRRKNSFSSNIDEHNKKKTALIPLLMVSERWRTAALESICDNCVVSFDYGPKAVKVKTPAWPADFSYPGFRKARLVKRVVVTVGLWRDMCDGTFCSTLSEMQYEGVAFPAARYLDVLIQSDGARRGWDYKNSISQEQVAGLAGALLQLVPAATNVAAMCALVNSSEPNYEQLYTALVSGLFKRREGLASVNCELSNTPIALGLTSTPGLTNIVQGLGVAGTLFARLAYLNAATLKSVYFLFTEEAHWRDLLFGGTTTPAVYMNLAEFYVSTIATSNQRPWAAIEDIEPFPALSQLSVLADYPFGDDLLFRGNGATLHTLHLPYSVVAQNKLGRFDVFRRSGVATMRCVSIGDLARVDRESVAEHSEASIKPLVHRMLEIAARLNFATSMPRDLVFQSLCAAPNTATLRHLDFGQQLYAVDDIIQLVAALPSLACLSCGIRGLQAEVAAIPASKRPSRLREKHYPLSMNFRTLLVNYEREGVSTEDVAYAAMLIAVLCPNFVQVVLPNEQRRDFGREIAWAWVNSTFRPYADAIRRLIYPEQDY
ncbi:hypothetical protein IWW57_000098 [Coemansia sp. S610]|nr:hypothetical protein IWW57_000098 [Coemansia sp. S610]